MKRGEILGKLQLAELLRECGSEEGGFEVKTLFTEMPHAEMPHAVSLEDRKATTLPTTLPAVIEESLRELPAMEAAQLRSMLAEYADRFAQDDADLGSTDVVNHTIQTGDHPPIRQPARRVPFALQGKVEDMVDDMLRRGVIQPSNSPWASPIVLVAKKDGSTRFCVDYRRLNSVTKMDVFPLPRIDDSLVLLAKSKYFTTLDLASGYWQVAMDDG